MRHRKKGNKYRYANNTPVSSSSESSLHDSEGQEDTFDKGQELQSRRGETLPDRTDTI